MVTKHSNDAMPLFTVKTGKTVLFSLFTEEEDVRTTNYNLIHTFGRGQPRRQPPVGLGWARCARGGRPSGPPAPPAQHPTGSAEG